MTPWHLWLDTPQAGTIHMARDREIYQAAQDQGRIGMRIYRWQEPTLSIGRFQQLPEPLLRRAQALNVPIVIRPTGGQAILHSGDLTFTIAAPANAGLGTSIRETYHLLSQAILSSLAHLGISAQQGVDTAAYRHLSHCFSAITPADIHWQGKKLVGSAQTRSRRGFLQQSVLYLAPDQELVKALFTGEETPLQGLQMLSPGLTFESLTEALIQGFAGTFSIEWLAHSAQACRPSGN